MTLFMIEWRPPEPGFTIGVEYSKNEVKEVYAKPNYLYMVGDLPS